MMRAYVSVLKKELALKDEDYSVYLVIRKWRETSHRIYQSCVLRGD